MAKVNYNERLFRGRVRRFVHMGRFLWLAKRVAALDPTADSVIELGCYDGRALEHLPRPPGLYVGYDANWERGLDLAKTKWGTSPQRQFRFAERPSDIDLTESFDIGVCMETLEHIPDEFVDGYLDALATVVRRRLYVTLPNEKHAPFLAKHVYHAFVGGGAPYTPSEVLNAALGRMDRVARNDHKGFDYEDMIARIGKRFTVERVESQPIPRLPTWTSPGVAFTARARRA